MAVSGTGGRLNCLIVLPVCSEATPGGKTPEFINQDEQSRRWLNDFRTKPFAIPLALEIIDPHRYTCLLIPHAPGAAVDLHNNSDLGSILLQFIQDKKLVCAIGMGVAGLLSACSPGETSWGFKSYSLTGSSLFELARKPNFSDLTILPEDAVRDAGGQFSASEPDAVHVVVDRHLVTGQNEASTLTAVQNLVLLSNQSRQSKISNK